MATVQKLTRASVEPIVEVFDQLRNLCKAWLSSNRPNYKYTGIRSITSSEVVVRVDDRRVNQTWDVTIPFEKVLPVK